MTIKRSFVSRCLCVAILALCVSSASSEVDQQDIGNWFNDPFFQVRSAVQDCPEPLGPRMRRSDAKAQEHYRVERGTSCYLSGECKKPNSYFYDADIAPLVQHIFDDPAVAAGSSLWITVSRRFVYVEGCRGEAGDLATVESRIQEVPDVQLVLVNVASNTHGHLPYEALRKMTQ